MHISKIQLENIKSHIATTFEFARGTTAITGENGAGKTTIIEAIAWVLFDLLEYKKEDFVRRGAKKGSVAVTFVSGLDEREYVVYRDTGTGYYVTDPRLQTRVAVKKEEVFRFLWQHLGLEPGTDLKSLFKQAIGVPQGTFTAIFLEGAAERKAAFDRLLKVEEYRQAAEKLRDTSRFLDITISSVRERIARYEGELSRFETVDSEHKSFVEQASSLAHELAAAEKDLAETAEQVRLLDEKERESAELRRTFERLRTDKEKAEIIVSQLEEAVARAASAKAKCDAARTQYGRHIDALGQLRELERERQERDKLRSQLVEVDVAIANVRAEQKRTIQDLELVQKAHAEISSLESQAAEQVELEKGIKDLRERAAELRAVDDQVKGLAGQIEKLRNTYKTNHDRLKDTEARAEASAQLEVLERRDGELTRSIAALYAGLERDEKFQSEIRNGLCPILSEKCLNLQDGQTLEAFVSSQFSELRLQIAGAESEYRQLADQLKSARQASQLAAAVEELRKREAELIEEGQRLKDDETKLGARQVELAGAAELLRSAEEKLRALGDPRGRIGSLQAAVAREAELRQEQTTIGSNLERLLSDRQILMEQMESYLELDAKWTALSQEREATVESHRVYLSNQAEAGSLVERQSKRDASRAELTASSAKAADAEKLLAAAERGYDALGHAAGREKLRATEKRHIQVQSALDAAKQRAEQLAAELAKFTEIRRSVRSEYREKERLEKVAETTSFIRDTLKEAAPRVARNYVYHVSLEAAQLFREITGNAEFTLKWAEDYSIVMEEDGYERPFASLSGGEQMAAALSVRLGLLKQLTDIRIAFFDEPTANMDAERRENLAMQISRISHFDQLFVISHDETFDNFVDNVISIERQPHI